MRIGQYDRRASLQQQRRVDDDAGGAYIEYDVVDTLWCSVQSQGGPEVVQARAIDAKLTHIVRARWRNDVRGNMRLVVGNVVLNINSAFDATGQRRELTMFCQEVLNA